MATLSSGYTARLEEQARRCDRARLLGKPVAALPCPLPQSRPTIVTTCSGDRVVRQGQTTSSAALNFQTTQLATYTYSPPPSGVPESIRIQQILTTTRDSVTQTPIGNPRTGATSFIVDPSQRFQEYVPYQPPPCPLPLPASATNAGNPAVRQPPCVGPNILLV